MKIKFLPQNIEVEGTPEKTLLQIATENHIEIRSICKGVPSCAECRVKIKEGENYLTPPSKSEINLIGTSYYIDGRRLSCQVRCFGPVTVDLTEQVNQDHLKNKKIRGFKSSKQVESKAVQDTMLLTEKPVIEDARPAPQQQPNQPRNQNQQARQQGQPNQGGGGGRNRNRNRNNNSGENRRPQPQNQEKNSQRDPNKK